MIEIVRVRTVLLVVALFALMLRDVGFRRVSLVQTYRDNDNRAIFLARK